jgi:hypothetical protein
MSYHLFVGYFAVQAGLGPEAFDAPIWNVRVADDRTLRGLLRRSNMPRDTLVEALGMQNPTTVDRWCDKGRRPSDEHLIGIARAIERDPAKQEELRQALRRHFALRQFVNDLADVVGWETVQDLVAAVLRFARGAREYMTSTWVEPAWRPVVCKMILDRWMMDAPSPRIVDYLIAREEASRWRGVLRGLQFASFHARFGEMKRPDGRVERVTVYPRIVAMTLFDATPADSHDSKPVRRTVGVYTHRPDGARPPRGARVARAVRTGRAVGLLIPRSRLRYGSDGCGLRGVN